MRAQIPYIIGSKNKKQPLHQFLGNSLSFVPGVLIGTGIGAGIGSLVEQPYEGAKIGLFAGAAAPMVIAGLAAIISKRRSIQKQKAYQQSSPLQNYIPGVGLYNAWKSLGFENNQEYKRLKQKKYKDSKWLKDLPIEYKNYVRLMNNKELENKYE